MSIYGFREGPVYRASSPQARLLNALDEPLSPLATAGEAFAQEALQSYGLGTVIRDFMTPRERIEPPRLPGWDGLVGYEQVRSWFAPADSGKKLDQDGYKASPYFRESIPWDAGMTEDRAAALALQADTKAVRDFYSEKQPIAAFFGSLAGAAVDPINFIPTVGPLVKAAAVAKFGRVGGAALSASLDAATNVAVVGALTAPVRARFGDDVSWQMQVSDIAMAAAIGGVFGLGEGVIGKLVSNRAAKRDLAIKAAVDEMQSLKRVQQARIALNESAIGLALDGDVRLSPNGIAAMEDIARSVIPDVVRQTEPRPVLSPADPAAEIPAPTDAAARTAVSEVREQISGLEEALNGLRSGSSLAPVSMRKPVIDTLKRMGGVHPDGPLADELRNLGVTSKTAPGLYRRDAGALRALDNIPMSEMATRFAGRGADDGAGYVAQQSWIDAVRDEMAGDPWLTPDEQLRFDEVRRPAEELDEFMNRFGIEWQGRPNAEVMADIRAVEHRLTEGFEAGRPTSDRSMSDSDLAHWEEQFADPDRPVEINATYRIDPKTGSYLEEAEIRQLDREGRLTSEDMALLAEADMTFRNAGAYGEALKTAVTCLL